MILPLLLIAATEVQGASPISATEESKTLPLTLPDVVTLALERDANVERSERSVKQAAMSVANAKSAFLPQASVSVTVSQSASGNVYRTDNVAYRQGLSGSFVGSVNANVNMPVDISGAIGRGVLAAKLQQQMTLLSDDKTKRDAVIDAQIAYLEALRAQAKRDIDAQLVASLEQLRGQALKQQPKLAPFFDVELANAYDVARMSQASLDQTLDSLKLQLQLPFETQITLEEPVPDPKSLPPVEASTDMVASTTQIRTGELRVKSASLSVEQAKDYNRPSLSLGGSASQSFTGRFIDSAGQSRTRGYSLNIALSLPLLRFDAGRAGNSVKSAVLSEEQAQADLKQLNASTELSIKQSIRSVDQARTRLEKLPDAKAAAAVLRSATQSFFNSRGDDAQSALAQVSNARSLWRYALSNNIDAKIDVVVASLRLAKVVGQPLMIPTHTAS